MVVANPTPSARFHSFWAQDFIIASISLGLRLHFQHLISNEMSSLNKTLYHVLHKIILFLRVSHVPQNFGYYNNYHMSR